MATERPGCLASFLRWLGIAGREPGAMPYHVRADFLSPAELSFYHVLRLDAGDWAVVCPKVGLGEIFFARTGQYRQNRTWMNRIDQKHVDFLLCDPKTMQPLLGVELDDASHRRPDRQKRDMFVERAFAAARLPLTRVAVQAKYDARELSAYLREKVATAATPSTAEVRPMAGPPAGGEVPLCPNCGSPMVVRLAKEGAHRGERFWGCPRFPKCRGMRLIEGAPGDGT